MTSYTRAQDEYLESEVLSAGPVRRVLLLYEGAIGAVEGARRALAAKDIPSRAAHVNRAMAILVELALSLDHSVGGQFSKDLVELYDYIQRRLLEGNFHQRDAPLAEAESLLKTVLEGWKNIPEVSESSAAAAAGANGMAVDHGSGDGSSIDGIEEVRSRIDQLA